MADRIRVGFDYGSSMAGFMNDVMKTVVQQNDYRGIGGHGVVNSSPHGRHRQTSIGLGNATINFREVK